jgi:hypothetical protein
MAFLKTKYLPAYFLERGRLAHTKGLFSPSVRGRAAEGGRGSLKHGVDWVEPDICCRT